MRLLSFDRTAKTFELNDFHGQPVPFYAILSHTWGSTNEEVTFEDAQNPQAVSGGKRSGMSKLEFAHSKAVEDGLLYVWIDTCCIKKSDSTELQRSLASMFYWYQQAVRCYVWLQDVSINDYVEEELPWKTAFSKSRWFKRGWTLQELIAPQSLVFYSKEGDRLGDKHSLVDTLSAVTGIRTTALLGADLSRFSKETRLSWAVGRKTKIPEDAAYSLSGIFDVTLPLLYADGDYAKRKQAALDELDVAIERKQSKNTKRPDFARIGGASWNDLQKLSKDQLQELNTALDSLAEKLLDEVEYPVNVFARVNCEEHRSKTGGPRYRAENDLASLLSRFGVGYDHVIKDRSRYEGRFGQKRGTMVDLKRLEVAWRSCGVTATRTMIDLKLWIAAKTRDDSGI